MATATTKTDGTKQARKPESEEATSAGLQRLIEGLQQNEMSALDAVKRFVDTVNYAFPDVGEDCPRRQIIDASFLMTEQFIGASNKLAINLVDVSEKAFDGVTGSSN